MELDVRRRYVRTRLEEAARFRVVRGERPATLAPEELEVLGREDPEEARLVCEEVDVHHAVVLQVVPDREVLPHCDPEGPEILRGAESREHEQHR